MATNPAAFEDVKLRWYPYPFADDDADAQALIELRLDEAWRALIAEAPSVASRLDAGTLAADDVVDVLASAALRVLRNPEGYTQGSESIDDYSTSWTAEESSNDLYFTRAELRRLLPARRGAFTITPG